MGAVEHADEQLRLPPETIEAKDELVQVALEVLWADAVEGPAEPSRERQEACRLAAAGEEVAVTSGDLLEEEKREEEKPPQRQESLSSIGRNS